MMAEGIKDSGEGLRWTAHPLRENTAKSVALVITIIIVVFIVSIAFKELIFTIIAVVLLFVSLSRYFLPTTFELSNDKIKYRFCGYTRTREWSEFNCYYNCRGGVHLSPFIKPHRLDTFRGLFLLCSENKEEVLAFVGRKVRKAQVG